MSRPLPINEPIFTLKLESVTASGTIGPDISIKLQVNLPKSKLIRSAMKGKNRWLYQRPVSRNLTQVTIDYEIVERDPKYTDTSGKQRAVLIIDSASIPLGKPGRQSVTCTIKAQEGKTRYREATFTLNFVWYLTANMMDLIRYIREEIEINSASGEAKIIAMLNASESWISDPLLTPPDLAKLVLAMRTLALAWFAYKVAPGQDWDHKPSITPPAICGGFSLDAENGMLVRNDFWSNFHYGYIGRECAFTEETLLTGAAIAQKLHDMYRIFAGDISELSAALKAKDYLKALGLGNSISTRMHEQFADILTAVKNNDYSHWDNDGDRKQISAGFVMYDQVKSGHLDLKDDHILKLLRAKRKQLPPRPAKAPEGIPPKSHQVSHNRYDEQ